MAGARGIPLRERKYAQTKLALMNAAAERLQDKSLEAISVKELCEAAVVSEATFFNYFPAKSDLLVYLSQLWAIEATWYGRQTAERQAGLAVIGAVFERAAQQIQDKPGLMGEIIAFNARLREKPQLQEVTRAERLMAFPHLDGIEDIPAKGIEAVLYPSLEQAIERGELPANTHLNTVMVGLIAIFYGVPLALRIANPRGIGSMYRQQLALLWAGVRTAARGQFT